MKYKLKGLGVIALAAVAPVLVTISCSGTSTNPEATVENQNLPGQGGVKSLLSNNYEKFKEEGKDFIKYDSDESNLITITKDADINLFFNSWGSITYTYMMRLALIAQTEVHYALNKGASGLSHQDRANVPEFTRYLKTNTVSPKDSDKQIHPNSQAFTVGSDVDGRSVTQKWLEVIRNNPSKKINVFWNSGHLDHLNGGLIRPLDLTAFPNVNLILLEDGAVVGKQINPPADVIQQVKGAKDVASFNKLYQYYIPQVFKNVKTFLSSGDDVKRLKEDGLTSYNLLDDKALFESVFNDRGVNGSRLMSQWPKITGLDWKETKDTLDKISKNGKPTMILLGSYGVDESPFLSGVYAKFGKTYNLLYKGHPGHFQWNDYVKRHYDGKITLLDPMISSEELTKEHTDQGMYFDKAACVGQTSAVIGGFHNSHNDITKDLLAAYINGKLSFYDETPGSGNTEIAKAFGPAYWASIVNGK